jgi:hypothetical protein
MCLASSEIRSTISFLVSTFRWYAIFFMWALSKGLSSGERAANRACHYSRSNVVSFRYHMTFLMLIWNREREIGV